MSERLLDRIWDILACPFCGNPLVRLTSGARCPACSQEYPGDPHNQLDVRLRKAKPYALEFELGSFIPPGDTPRFEPLRKNPAPQVDFDAVKIPEHLTKELMSYFPRAKDKNSFMLDLGCGDAIHRRVCEHAGFTYVGLDYASSAAPLLGDGHALPFKNDSFDFILSVAVLEHTPYPLIMMKEAYRVLKPGGRLIGTVAFLEPFHADSFYHHTHLGTYHTLTYAGFAIEAIAPSKEWSVLTAAARMSLFPKMPLWLSKTFVMPVYAVHRIWWKLGYLATRVSTARETNRALCTTGAFSFIASK